MHEYDVTLKGLLQRSLKGSVFSDWMGVRVTRWHNTDLPVVRSRRADLLGEDPGGVLFHLELQSRNDPEMALRMLEYASAIRRKFRSFPRQLVLYVGAAPLKMEGGLTTPGLSYQCRIADIREVDSERLLRSAHLEDSVLAVLAGAANSRELTRRILHRIAESPPGERSRALTELTVISGLRAATGVIIEEETRQMPILDDIMDHPVLGRERRRGIELGLKKGREEGIQDGERQMLLRQMTRRFGRLPAWARKRLDEMKVRELERIGVELLSARTLEDLLG
ncbi:MAG: DUF4351 domain-containing protein [Acidobacteriota bacterium]|nr:DUF4351 domain-containing protein [Acidobacteriota bacterium]